MLVRWPSAESQAYLNDFVEVLEEAHWSRKDLMLSGRPEPYRNIKLGWQGDRTQEQTLKRAMKESLIDFAEDEFNSNSGMSVLLDVGVVPATREQTVFDRIQ